MTNRKAIRRARRIRRTVLTVCLMALVAVISIGGTIAWLTASTQEVKNTFTVGNITIDLNEHKYNGTALTNEVVKTNDNYKMVPGDTLPKDPYVTIGEKSEECYLFVEVVESTTLDTYISYTVDSSKWTKTTLTGKRGGEVYVYKVAENDYTIDYTASATNYSILTGNQVTVNSNVTKTQMENLNATNAVQPTMSFYGYAVQAANVTDYTTAWGYVPTP